MLFTVSNSFLRIMIFTVSISFLRIVYMMFYEYRIIKVYTSVSIQYVYQETYREQVRPRDFPGKRL